MAPANQLRLSFAGSEDGEAETETCRAAKPLWRTTTRTSGPRGLNLLNRRLLERASNSRELLRSNAVVVNVTVKRRAQTRHVRIRETNANEAPMTHRNTTLDDIKTVTLIRAFRTELENLVGDAKGKGTSGSPARPKVPMCWPGTDCSVAAVKRVNSRGAKGAGHPRRDRTESTRNRKNSLVSAEGGSLRWVARAVISRETYVRFCERPGVQFPGPTRRRTGNRPPMPITFDTEVAGNPRQSQLTISEIPGSEHGEHGEAP
jgi:hypothetical protein